MRILSFNRTRTSSALIRVLTQMRGKNMKILKRAIKERKNGNLKKIVTDSSRSSDRLKTLLQIWEITTILTITISRLTREILWSSRRLQKVRRWWPRWMITAIQLWVKDSYLNYRTNNLARVVPMNLNHQLKIASKAPRALSRRNLMQQSLVMVVVKKWIARKEPSCFSKTLQV